jgi:hypothetical protein
MPIYILYLHKWTEKGGGWDLPYTPFPEGDSCLVKTANQSLLLRTVAQDQMVWTTDNFEPRDLLFGTKIQNPQNNGRK